MTWHWRKSKACDLDELLDDLNPALKDLEGEMQSPSFTSVETFLLGLKPVTQPAADATEALLYLDEADDYLEIVLPTSLGGGRGRIAVDWDVGSFPPDMLAPQNLTATRTGYVLHGDNGTLTWAAIGASSGLGPDGWLLDGYILAYAKRSVLGSGSVWDSLARNAVTFDTTTVPTTPISGTFSGIAGGDSSCLSQLNGGLSHAKLYCYDRTSPDALIAAADFQDVRSLATVLASDSAPLVTQTDETVITFTLNAAGLAHVDNTGFTCFSVLLEYDVALGAEPTGQPYDAFSLYGTADPGKEPTLHLVFI